MFYEDGQTIVEVTVEEHAEIRVCLTRISQNKDLKYADKRIEEIYEKRRIISMLS